MVGTYDSPNIHIPILSNNKVYVFIIYGRRYWVGGMGMDPSMIFFIYHRPYTSYLIIIILCYQFFAKINYIVF